MNKVYECVENLIHTLDETQEENIAKAAQLFAESLKAGGMLQAFGSGHSQAGASELCFRAGGFIPTKQIKEPAGGAYEGIEGVGTYFMKKVDIRSNDVLVLISNSGRNPLAIEMAIEAKKKGAKIVVITSMASTTVLPSKHSSGKNLYQYGDVVIDNCVKEGDAMISLEGLDTEICGMSAITTAMIIQAAVLKTAEILLAQGIVPPVFKSQNIIGGAEYNDKLVAKYFDRIYHI